MINNKITNIPNFVLITDIIKEASIDLRYYGTFNFVGERINGYDAPYAVLTKEAALALKKVSDDLKLKGYRLKIFDAYRPKQAVTHFFNWCQDVSDTRMKKYFYPNLDKSVLFEKGYIAEKSSHSRGSTVDLTLIDMNTEKELDMGSSFDYFGDISHIDYLNLSKEQHKNRMFLRDIMVSHGFEPIKEEWWHFTLKDEPYKDTYFSFPINDNLINKKI